MNRCEHGYPCSGSSYLGDGVCDEQVVEGLRGYDWSAAFEYANAPTRVPPRSYHYGLSNDGFTRADVASVEFLSEGENDGPDWIAVGELKDGRFFALRAGCDYTGWDCQAGGTADVAKTLDHILIYGLTDEERRRLGIELMIVT